MLYNVFRVPVKSVDEILTTQMKAIEQYFHGVLFVAVQGASSV